jgi:8-oxo-dGTP pyrophosphatase MutT (NUDIX family)
MTATSPSYIGWLRGLVGHARLPLVYVTAIVRDARGHVLFQRRADFGDAWWGLPGGLIEPGESPEAALAREVLEETGLTVTPTRLTGVYSSLRYAFAYPNGDQVQQVTLCYLCNTVPGSLTAQPGEVDALAYFSPDALPPRPRWYADMLTHALAAAPDAPPYFDPPEAQRLDAPFQTILDLRQVIGNAAVVWPGVSALVLDDEGRLLLQQRGDNGFWGLPGGGLDLGETVAHTAIRECQEETGLVVEPYELLGCQGGWRIVFPNGDELFSLNTLFACRVSGGSLRVDGREVLDVGFFARDALPPTTPYLAGRIDRAFAWYTARQR